MALCRATKVSRSGYYAWANKPPSSRCVEDAYLTDTIREIHQRTLPRSLLKFSGGHSSFRLLPDRTLRV
jgi:hypothetical protein